MHWRAPTAETWPIDGLRAYERNSRRHTPEQAGQIAASIRERGGAHAPKNRRLPACLLLDDGLPPRPILDCSGNGDVTVIQKADEQPDGLERDTCIAFKPLEHVHDAVESLGYCSPSADRTRPKKKAPIAA
ncbi:hypothetical protein [Bradyrhizobium sp. Cp5.3]|uniref:hypothetical protein n=1 Tax=Bradyrhizobium sp. Cp5.3 TaxID=443598 RepID=UPI0012EC1789|nr:hypothetical protein [Bradyrhizobium sp. Cp5.3]